MSVQRRFRVTSLGLMLGSALLLLGLSASTRPTEAVAPAAAAPTVTQPAAADAAARAALDALRRGSAVEVSAQPSRETGAYGFVRAARGGVLAADDASRSPEARALAFLAAHGAVVGMSEAERALAADPAGADSKAASALRVASAARDQLGATHVRLDQTYRGLRVFGAQLVVHMNARGITAVNGSFVPGVAVSTTPALTPAAAAEAAAAALSKGRGAAGLRVTENTLGVYRTGLLEGFRGESALAYGVRVADASGPLELVWVGARTGGVLARIPLRHSALNRRVYSPKYDSSNPDLFVVRKEEDPLPSAGTFEDLFQFTGHAYRLYSSAFGRDSYDGLGSVMRTVYLVNSVCPNAYWDGQTTNYCPEIDADDVVAHEWAHGYTQFTHDLVYSFQSGALNESYSDIFGETVDLLNGVDAEGGSNNVEPSRYELVEGEYVQTGGGVRWRIGEDVLGLNQPAALGTLRDMWQPHVFGDPDKVSSEFYHCAPSDGGGVHTNSGVPNHAFAILVDGKTFNGVTTEGIGQTKALHIYYRAMTVYQTSTTNFAQHEQALRASCDDLVGRPLNALSTSSAAGAPSNQTITAADCRQVANAAAAVELSRPPAQCNFGPLLTPNPPAACSGSATVFAEDFENGMGRWTLNSAGSFAGWPGYNWVLDSTPPGGRAGSVAFAFGGSGGVCGDPNGDRSGTFSMDTPEIAIPSDAPDLKLSFDHFVATEFLVDGGNLKISVNGGAFALVPQSAYLFNAPPSALRAAPPLDQNTNPKAGEFAWSGADPEVGAFGTTIVDLSALVSPGDTFRIRFDFGLDGCGGNQGWYVDNVRVYSCPVLAPPVLSIGAGYQEPDRDGSYELRWARPEGASGPDLLQESTTSCGPLFSDDAQAGLTQWVTTTQGGVAGQGIYPWETSEAKPEHDSTAFWARAAEGVTNASSFLTTKTKVALPATGTTSLTFSDWNINESDDSVAVEVSEDGASWTTVYLNARSESAPTPEVAFATEPLFRRRVDLTPFGGRAVFIRFRYTVGAENKPGSVPLGWYVDDIAIANETWSDVATVGGTSHTVTNRASGSYCYRVRTAYDFGTELAQSGFSNLVSTVVDACSIANVASSLNGAVAVASSVYPNWDFNVMSAIDGDRTGRDWGAGGGWNDATRGAYPDWLEVHFAGPRRLSEVRVYTLQDNYQAGQEPTAQTTATSDGVIDFDIQAWDGSAWVTVPGGQIRGNDRALRAVTFPELSTTKIRVLVHNARANYSRVVEVEAIGCPAP
ncbi:MAG TPA: M4 family metallopeptidase [Pyrinomonadaceae bacterium]|nr:M4 family metallopeptidase [Pyrinomonadaceae bacterium]